MEKTFKRLLSFAVALVMVLGLIPVTQIEVKAEAPTTTTEKSAKDDTYTKDLEWVTEPGADGTGGTAVCPVCGGEAVEWLPMDSSYQGHTDANPVKTGNFHYYVPDQADGSKGTVTNTTVEKTKFFLYIANTTHKDDAGKTVIDSSSNFCLHLNGNNLSFNGLIWMGGGHLNLMGTGELKGNYPMATVATQPYRGSTINNHSYYSQVRLYSGTVKSGTGDPAYGISTLSGSPYNYMYDDAKVEGIRMVSGTFTMEGGEVDGAVHMEPYFNTAESYSKSDLVFKMKDGKISGGEAENGGSVRMIGCTNEAVTVKSTFTMDDGVIEGGKASAYGGNVYLKAGAKSLPTFTIKGGVIQNGEATKNGGNVYITGTDKNNKATFKMENDAELIGGKADIGGNLYANSYTNTNIGKDAKLTQKIYEEGDSVICNKGANLGMAGQSAVVNLYGTLTGGYANTGGSVYTSSCTLNIYESAKISGGRSTGSGGNIYAYGAPGTAKQDSDGKWVITTTKAVITVSGTIENGYAENGNAGNVGSARIDFTLNKSGKISGGYASKAGGNLYLAGTWTGDGSTKAEAEEHVASKIMIYGTVEGGEAGSSGGNLYVGVAGTTTIDGATFADGVAGSNGGNLAVGSSSGSAVKIQNSTFTDGVAGASGGNLYLNNRNYTFSGNTVTGGISTHVPGDTKDAGADGDTDGKKAEWGSTAGGGNIFLTEAGLTITDSTISGGKAAGGGNIMAYNTNGILTLGEGTKVLNGTSVSNANTYYRAGNIQITTFTTLNVEKGAEVSGAVGENNRSGAEITAMWKTAIVNINGGTVGASASGKAIYIDGSKNSPTATVNINDGTVLGTIARNENQYTSINVYHGVISHETTAETYKAEGVTISEHNGLFEAHTVAPVAANGATCTAAGVIAHHACSVCAQTFTDATCATKLTSVEDPAHTQTFKAEEPASCTEPGVKAYYACSCGKNYEDEACTKEIADLTAWEIEQKDHDYVDGVCVNGCEKTPCENDDHNWGEEIPAKDATCIATGNEAYYFCDECEQYAQVVEGLYVIVELEDIERPIDSENHSGEAVLDEESVVAPSCGADGYTGDYVCPGCGEIITKGETDPATGEHNYATEIDRVASTCTVPGSVTMQCACGEKKTDPLDLDPENHVLTYVPEKAATGLEDGYEAYYSCACGKLFKDAEGEQELDQIVVLPKLDVIPVIPEEEIEIEVEEGAELTETVKNEIINVVQNNTQINEVENLPDDYYLQITLAAATVKEEQITKLTYDVTPMTVSGKVSQLDEEIIFYLPVPTGTGKTTAALFHGDELVDANRAIIEDENQAYVMVTAKDFSLYSVDLAYEEEFKGEAEINGQYYATLEDALAAAKAGDKISLNADVTVESNIFVMDGVTLNLNGHKLTTDQYVMAFFAESYIVDESAGNTGRLVMDINKLRLLESNTDLPVKMSDGIMFVTASSGHCWSETYSCYQSWVEDMDQALVDALKANTAEALGLKFQVVLTWGNGSKLIHTFTQNTVDGYMTDWETMAMNLTVTGGEELGVISYQARIVFAEDTAAEVVLWASEAVER